MIVAIVDTSILCELLQVPGRSKPGRHEEVTAGFEERLGAGHQFLVPLTSILETGNHIAHGQQGSSRRAAAERFVEFVRKAIDGDLPFTPTRAPEPKEVAEWLDGFPDDAMRELSLGDRSLIAEWERQRAIHAKGRVYIWALDEDLTSYDTGR